MYATCQTFRKKNIILCQPASKGVLGISECDPYDNNTDKIMTIFHSTTHHSCLSLSRVKTTSFKWLKKIMIYHECKYSTSLKTIQMK